MVISVFQVSQHRIKSLSGGVAPELNILNEADAISLV